MNGYDKTIKIEHEFRATNPFSSREKLERVVNVYRKIKLKCNQWPLKSCKRINFRFLPLYNEKE